MSKVCQEHLLGNCATCKHKPATWWLETPLSKAWTGHCSSQAFINAVVLTKHYDPSGDCLYLFDGKPITDCCAWEENPNKLLGDNRLGGGGGDVGSDRPNNALAAANIRGGSALGPGKPGAV
jgi:hypothetical protein